MKLQTTDSDQMVDNDQIKAIMKHLVDLQKELAALMQIKSSQNTVSEAACASSFYSHKKTHFIRNYTKLAVKIKSPTSRKT